MSNDSFFKAMEEHGLALSYDDVQLKSGGTDVMPSEVSLESKFSRNVGLKIPIVSAAMDTVTEYRLAVELAKLGGIGVIHRSLTPEKQAAEVARVKFYLNGRIDKPICLKPDQTVESVLAMKADKGYRFNSFPVLDFEGRVVGVVTNNDFEFCVDNSRKIEEIMSKEITFADAEVKIEEAFKLMLESRKKVLPLLDKNQQLAGLYTLKDLKRIILGEQSSYNLDPKGRLRVAAAVGTGPDSVVRIEELVKKQVDAVVIDTAHADSKNVLEFLKAVKQQYPCLDVVAGNISEPESAQRLCEAGADGIKVGQGPGAICTTRVVAGIGCPQITAVYSCAKVAGHYNIPICADGGIKYSGDIPKALGSGAHSVMLGSLLAGTDESPGERIFKDGRQWKFYRGMGSLGAMMDNRACRERYGQSSPEGETEGRKLVPEGVEGMVPYKGKVEDVIFQYIGGLRSGMGYVGAANIEELREKARFHRVTQAGQREAHPHDIVITKEAPNYTI